MIEEILDGVFEKASGVGVGHLVRCPVPHLDEVPRILEVERASSEAHYASKFRVVEMDGGHFRSKQKLPIKALSLHDTEELLISKAKKRPCVIVACHNTSFKDTVATAEIKKRRHLQDNSMMLAPLYGTASPEDVGGFPPKMVARIRAFLYNQFFYLPRTCPKTKVNLEKESIVRLDRLFPASPNRGVETMDIKLSAEALALLTAMLRERFGAPPDGNLTTVRQILYETLPEDCRPKPA